MYKCEMFFKLSIIVTFLSTICVNGQESPTTSSSAIIFKSEPVAILSAPWQVSVRLKAFEMQFYGNGHICGGSVISQRVVLSAAHCLVDEVLVENFNPNSYDDNLSVYRAPDEFVLVMGSESLFQDSPDTLEYDVLEIAVHVAFNLTTLANDVAMFFINGDIPENWPTVRAIPFNTAPELNGMLCSTSGWNRTDDADATNLRGTFLPVVDRSTCNAVYGILTTDLICAGYDQQIEHDFCDGDTGGPLICLGHLAGIVLEGNSCARTGYLGLYVNVLYHYNWIVANNKTFNYSHYNEPNVMTTVEYPSPDLKPPTSAGKHYGEMGITILYLIIGIYLT